MDETYVNPDTAGLNALADFGTAIGPYKLISKLGEGGMGAVFLAEQERPVRRRVALKIIRQGMASDQFVVRFEVERQALAMMDHPCIAKVFDAGATDAGTPYFVMELVEGIPITNYCDDNRLTVKERLKLFVMVCHAIQHAHQKGVIHRDIKPTNILVASVDGAPLPKVIDFGLAKAIEQSAGETAHTQAGAVIGTLKYMAPEQAETGPAGVDTRSDVYSLGVVLYELLTGVTPWGATMEQVSIFERLRILREEEPSAPSTKVIRLESLPAVAAARKSDPARLTRVLKGDLDWIVMKCLEKEIAQRYDSAQSLAADVERYLLDEPIEARPPSRWYRAQRYARKYWRSLAAAACVIASLVIGIVVSVSQANRAQRAEALVREAARQMQAERDRTRQALVGNVAERLDADLQRLAMAGQVLAATVAQREDWRESDLERWMRTVLAQDERIFGMSIAFEPRQFDAAREDYCLYAFRGANGIETKHLLPPTYLPLYREWDWYKTPLRDGRARWSEPYVDTGGGEIPMVTFSTPFERGGKPAGVLTLDLSIHYFDVLRGWLTELILGENGYGFVVSETGLVVSHPDPELDLARRAASGKPAANVRSIAGADATFLSLCERMKTEPTGGAVAIDPSTGKPTQFLFARIASAGWSFVAGVKESRSDVKAASE